MLTSLSDALVEGGETVTATLNAVTGGVIGTSKAAIDCVSACNFGSDALSLIIDVVRRS